MFINLIFNYFRRLPCLSAALGMLLSISCGGYHSYKDFATSSVVQVAAFSPDNKSLAGVLKDHDSAIQIWDATTGDFIQELKGVHKQSIQSLIWSKDGHKLVSTGNDNRAVIWDLKTQKGMELVHGNSEISTVESAVFSPDERFLATYQASVSTVYIWDTETGTQLPNRHYSSSAPIFSKDGTSLVFVDLGDSVDNRYLTNVVTLWKFSTNEETSFPKKDATPMSSLHYAKNPMALPIFSDDNTQIYAIELGSIVKLETWDIKTQSIVRSIDLAPQSDNSILFTYQFSNDHKRLLLNWSATNQDASIKKIATVWDVRSGSQISTLNYLSLYSKAYFLNPDGSIIYTYTIDPESPYIHKLNLWDANTGASFLALFQAKFPDNMQHRTFLAFRAQPSSDGSKFAVFDADHNTHFWALDQVSP